MKILHIINNLGSGGAEKLLQELIPIMNKMENIEVNILLLTDQNNVFYDSLINKGVKIDIIKYRNIYSIRNIFEIKKYIVNGYYDIVHSHIFPTQYWVAFSRFLIRSKEVKFITTEHNTYNRRRDKFYFRYIDKIIYSQYDTIISITGKTMENLINWIDSKQKNKKKHIVIENGIDLQNIKIASCYNKNQLVEDFSEDDKLICMIGRFSEQKDQSTLIRVLSTLSKNIHLILVGEGPLLEENKNLSNELGISDRVHFLGFRQDIPRILKTVDIVVLSSHWEGFGLSALEGMAAEKPVIASNVDGLREIVENFGIIFKDETDLKTHIEKLISDKLYYEKISKLCLQRSEHFNIEKNVISLINTYTLLKNKSRSN